MSEQATKRIKIASVSLNQLVYDYATNIRNFQKAIDLAVADKADILATEELSLVGYPADDYHQWNKDNDAVWSYINFVARYAQEKDPNLVISLGAPWHYADKSLPASDPAYNINNRPFNVQFTIQNGRVVSQAAKTILADGPAEYEPRQFSSWPLSKGTIMNELPDGSRVPYGKPIVHLVDKDGTAISLTHETCADGWPGVADDLTINEREQTEARHIVALAKDNDLSVVLNPSASKPQPAINKERIRADGLCKTGSKYCGVFVYTNFLGSASGTYAAEGSQIYAQDGKIIQHGNRYSFKDVSYSSATVDVPVAMRGVPAATVEHNFKAHRVMEKTGVEAAFDEAYATAVLDDEQLAQEEYMRSIALWLRDYITKPSRSQGYVVSLSGGKDSAYGAVAVATMIELDVKENGIAGFFERFKGLKFKDDVLKIYREKGEDAAVSEIKKRMLTCVYLPTENSGEFTREAARFLIEGGTLEDGTKIEGIGGKFYVAPVQNMLDEATIAFTGLNLDRVVKENLTAILDGRYHTLPQEDRFAIARAKVMGLIKDYINAPLGTTPSLPDYVTRNCVNRVPTWSNPADDLTLQNIQARVRLPIPWTIANQEGKIALVTSNESEAVHSYTTAGGDMHMGGANPIGGVPKHTITGSLKYFEEYGLIDLKPVKSLYWINRGEPTAELRKQIAGVAAQTDEKDLGFTYQQSEFIEERLLVNRQTPGEVFRQMRGKAIFPNDIVALRDILVGFAKRWESGQFKRIMSTLAPHVGSNVDPHQAVRTTVLGDHFRTGCAHVTLDVIAELTGGADKFRDKFGVTLRDAKTLAGMNADFKMALNAAPVADLLDPQNWAGFEETNRKLLRYIEPAPEDVGARPAAGPSQLKAALQ